MTAYHEESSPMWTGQMFDAIAEIQALISSAYPGASFTQTVQDDPAGVHLIAAVDTDDPDMVVDCFIERLLTIQIERGIPLYVVPVRSPKRVATHPKPVGQPYDASRVPTRIV